jgi:hypothetical protein
MELRNHVLLNGLKFSESCIGNKAKTGKSEKREKLKRLNTNLTWQSNSSTK